MQLIKKIIPVLVSLCLSQLIKAQVVQPMGFSDYSLPHQINIGNGTLKTTKPSASLELAGTAKGFLPTRVTTAQRNAIASPDTNLVVINTDTHHWNLWNGSAWIDISIDTSLSTRIDSLVTVVGSLANDTARVYAVTPLYAVNDTTIAIRQASIDDSGYLSKEGYDSLLSAIRRIYTASGDGVDTIRSVDGHGNDSVVALIDVGSDKWIEAPQVVYSGVPYNYDITGGIMRLGTRRIVIEPTHVVLDSSEADPRIDKFYSDSSGHSSVLKGVADPNPVEPQVDPSWQKEIAFLQIPGGVGQTPTIDTTFIYKNNEAGNWALTSVGLTADADNTNNVFEGTKSVNVTNQRQGNYHQFTYSGSFDLSNYDAIAGFIKLKQTIPSTASLRILWFNGGTQIGQMVTIPLVKNNTTTYQAFSLQKPLFALNSNIVTNFRIQYVNTNGTVHSGQFEDYIYLQRGISNPTSEIAVTSVSANATQDSIKYTTSDGATHIFRYSASGFEQVLNAGANLTKSHTVTLHQDSTFSFYQTDGDAVLNFQMGFNYQIDFATLIPSLGYSTGFSMNPGEISIAANNNDDPNHNSTIENWTDSINIKPYKGNLIVDTLLAGAGTKALRYNPTTGLITYADTTTGSGVASTLDEVLTAGNSSSQDMSVGVIQAAGVQAGYYYVPAFQGDGGYTVLSTDGLGATVAVLDGFTVGGFGASTSTYGLLQLHDTTSFQHIGILSLEFHVDKLSRPLL